jgi:N-acetylmuramoyl-L-alanine amidase
MPCVLVEVSFIDHHREGKRLASEAYQDLLAKALLKGVENFLKEQNLS